MALIYKKAAEKDIPVISQLAERIWKKHYVPIIGIQQVEYMLQKMYSSESVLKQMKEQQEYTLAYDDNIPVGYISVSTKEHTHYFLHKFYVDTEKQRKGIGSEFLGYLLQSLKTAQSIELTVNRKNFKAINFYFKMGFVIKEVADFDIGNGFFMNDFIMIKKI